MLGYWEGGGGVWGFERRAREYWGVGVGGRGGGGPGGVEGRGVLAEELAPFNHFVNCRPALEAAVMMM